MQIIYQNQALLHFIVYFLTLFSDLLAYVYVLLKIYRILCFTKITFDQLPLVNPYKWPMSFFRVVTQPYFRFWTKLLPTVKVGKIVLDVSTIFGLEVLGGIIFLSLHLRMELLLVAQDLLEAFKSYKH